MKVGTIKEIWRYPVKSMFGERVQSAQVQSRGFADDRCWAVRDDISGEFVGGRKYPKLMQLKARYLEEPALGFGPESQSTVAVEFPDGRVMASDDPDISAVLSMFLGQRVSLCPRPASGDRLPHRLAKPMSPSEIRYALGMKPDDPDPDFSSFSVKLLLTLSRYTTPPGALYDVYPLHFMTTAALQTMRGYYPQGDFRIERYRPSFVIETEADQQGIVENEWQGRDLQIGDARIRCNHPTIRCSMPGAAQPGMAKDPNIPRALMRYANQHLGAYATPRNRAEIRVGDAVELLPESTGRVAVYFDRLGGRVKARAIGFSNRLTDWQEKRVQAQAVESKQELPRGFRPFVVQHRKQESADIVSFTLADPERRVLPRFLPGQHLVLAIPQADGRMVYRPYSLSAAAGDGQSYRISVKRERLLKDGAVRDGRGSGWLHDNLRAGDTIALKDPGGQFADVPGDREPLVLISSGIGITPYMAMLDALAQVNPERPVTLLHGIRRLADFAFAEELEQRLARLPHARLKLFVSQPSAEETLPKFACRGRMQMDEQWAQLQPAANSKVFLCGKPEFTAELRRALLACGVDPAAIQMESFGASQVVDRTDANRYRIHCSQSQRQLSWDPQQDNLLSFAEAEGVEVSSGCRFGACQACEVTMLAGEVEYPPEVQLPAGKNKILMCSARPKSDLELEL